jgi:hypothetical protein
MTLSDTDLEARLRRDLQARADAAPPAPRDLAELTRARHRSLRRRELGLVAAGIAAALVLVGVPVLSSSLTADPDRGQTAQPTAPSGGRLLPSGSDLYERPTRGGLADDERWLRGMAAVAWTPDNPYRDPGMEFAEPPPAESRRVAYADDVPSGRVALRGARDDVHALAVLGLLRPVHDARLLAELPPHLLHDGAAGAADGLHGEGGEQRDHHAADDQADQHVRVVQGEEDALAELPLHLDLERREEHERRERGRADRVALGDGLRETGCSESHRCRATR